MIKKKVKTQMEKLTAGYTEFIKGKQVNKSGKVLFDKALQSAVKQRDSR